MAKFCNGHNKKRQTCAAYATHICEDCGKVFCHNHINRDKHFCDDSVKGVHSIWKEKWV
jgi:hypothetical protein